jgi:2-polyprenyl-3-methyl-5-hydroxy-6-metoxy-1,4-benzoquinol methylase
MWASTKRSYAELHLKDFDAEGKVVEPSATPAQAAGADSPAPSPAAKTQETRANAINSPLERLHAPYFVQRVHVSSDVIGLSRLDVFKKLCAGQRILHIGCADWPITDPKNSLHLALEPHCAKLDGFDIHAEALDALAPYTKGRLYSRFEDLTDEYDLVLVPEVMEHVPDVGGFLAQLHALNAPAYVITVPDAYQCHKRHFDYVKGTETFVEIVHPDHNCWYTPYTLSNVITKYTPWRIDDIWFFNNISLLALVSKPRPA